MEPISLSSMSKNTNTAVATATSATSADVELLLSPACSSVSTITSNTKTTEPCHNNNHRVLQNCSNSNVIQHHQYPSILVAPPSLVSSSLIHSSQTSSTTTTPGSIPQFQHHSASHQMITASTVPMSTTIVPTSNISTLGMALSPFGILPHERVVPHPIHHRHQHKKLSSSPSSKTLIDTSSTSNTQILNSPVINPQRFYVEPTHFINKMKQYDNAQQQQYRGKMFNGNLDKNLPVVSSTYSPQTYEQRYQPRTTSHQVGYLSVITRTAVTTTNGVVMNDILTNSNYYQTQPIPLQTKTTDNHDKHYYHFDSTVSASQTPQQQLDNILLMGTPVQRGDPMHIVKNLQSMQSDIDCYGVKRMIEQQPRILGSDHSKTIGATPLLNNSKCTSIEHHHQHLQQLPKSALIDSSSSYGSHYFNRRQPPPAHLHQHIQPHLQQHIISGNPKILPTPTSLTVVSTNGNTYLDVHHHRHHRWNLDQPKPPSISTSFSTSLFNQPSIQQQNQTYHSTVSTFNIQPPVSSIHQHQHISQPIHHDNFVGTSVNPTYYSSTSTIESSNITSVTTTSPTVSLYNRPHHNNRPQQHSNKFRGLSNTVHHENYVVNDNNNSPSTPHVIVPNIEQELSYLCDDSTSTSFVKVKPLNVTTQKPSFIDSYIKFIHGSANNTVNREEDETFNEKKPLISPLRSSTPKPISKPYIPLAPSSKPKVVSTSEPIFSSHINSEEKKASNVSTTIITKTDDDPRYFPLPKTSSSITGISDDRSEGSNGENSCLSGDDDQDQWWISSSKGPYSAATSVRKHKVEIENKKNKNASTLKKKPTNLVSAIKKQKTQHEQPRRQLTHRLAKEKTKLLNSINGELGIDDEDILSDADSDIDPAWKPNSDDNDTSKNSNVNSNRRHFNHKKYSKVQFSNSSNPPSTSPSSNINNNIQTDDSIGIMPFKSGSFVALKSQFQDNGQVIPQQLWRVDGKSLLQKFQRCNEDNVYKSLSAYTGWNPSHYNMYCQVAVQYVTSYNNINVISNKSSNTEVLVELLCKNDDKKSSQNDSTVSTKNKSTAHSCTSKQKANAFNSTASVDDQNMMLRANFDVYIQTLVSQALDPNFLGEIYLENDQYFLSNVRAIETVTQSWVKAIDSIPTKNSGTDLSKVENVHTLITRFPIIDTCSVDESIVNNLELRCIVCGTQGFVEKQKKFLEISLSGTEYNSRTLRNIDYTRTFFKIKPMKQVHCCSSSQCIDKLLIKHSLVHLKYHIYKECCKRVAIENDNSCKDSIQDTTTVLNRLLADDEWIEKMFQMVCNTWSRAKMFIPNR